METLDSISVIDGRYNALAELSREHFTEGVLFKYRLYIEIEWLKSLHKRNLECLPAMNSSVISKLDYIYNSFCLNDVKAIKAIETRISHDVKSLEYWMRNEFSKDSELTVFSEFIHINCTSGDINNLAYALMFKSYLKGFNNLIKSLINILVGLSEQYADAPMSSRTHGQIATPTTFGKEMSVYAYRLSKALKNLNNINLTAKINGSVGNYNPHILVFPNFDWLEHSKYFVETVLDLELQKYTTQIEPHDNIGLVLKHVSSIANIVIDFNVDLWLYISMDYVINDTILESAGSSVMPHKINPINFENSESLLNISVGILDAISNRITKSRLQRDLTDSAALRNIGYGLSLVEISIIKTKLGLSNIHPNTELMLSDLRNNNILLSEAIQTMSRKYGVKNVYEQLKDLSRCVAKSEFSKYIKDFIRTLEIPESEKELLLNLKPENYTGMAKELASNIRSEVAKILN